MTAAAAGRAVGQRGGAPALLEDGGQDVLPAAEVAGAAAGAPVGCCGSR